MWSLIFLIRAVPEIHPHLRTNRHKMLLFLAKCSFVLTNRTILFGEAIIRKMWWVPASSCMMHNDSAPLLLLNHNTFHDIDRKYRVFEIRTNGLTNGSRERNSPVSRGLPVTACAAISGIAIECAGGATAPVPTGWRGPDADLRRGGTLIPCTRNHFNHATGSNE